MTPQALIATIGMRLLGLPSGVILPVAKAFSTIVDATVRSADPLRTAQRAAAAVASEVAVDKALDAALAKKRGKG